ncbi:recQ-mediated genome instability protein 1 [Stylosanthes scabra]|uniref:RecQ-mediated genome instability protein 1 n=1 Tax=Stylosanthes scabra TaxID=79078 RepID=A0ABU6RC82_9FABA|nr:recQ-mediated genome instability protein 1 [Stylosanthes scabra]
MTIRRLVLDDDDEEEEEHHRQVEQLQTPQPTNSSNFPSAPLQISDDDDDAAFIDVPDHLSPPPPPQPRSSSCPVGDSLRRLGLGLKREWVNACLSELEGSVRGFAGFDVTAKAKLCFEQFLFADMNSCGSGVLPSNVHSMHLVNLSGPFVLQVDEILNMSCPLRGRYQQAPPGLKRCLKLSLTDGIQRVFAMEYRPIQALDVSASSGLKVAISNVHVRRGLLMLVPETIEILGGLVEQLDAARKRVVDELSKPPRGNRTKNGVLPPLATRATLAAWPASGVDDSGRSGPAFQSTDSVQINSQDAGLTASGTGNRITTEDTMLMGRNAASNSIPSPVTNADAMNVEVHADTNPSSFANSRVSQFSSVAWAEEMHIDTAATTMDNSVGNQPSHMFTNVAMAHKDTVNITRKSYVPPESSPIVQNVETDKDVVIEDAENDLPRGSSSTVLNNRDVHMVDDNDHTIEVTDNDICRGSSSISLNSNNVHMVDDSDHPHMLSADQEVPFTYLASLSAKWVTMKEKVPSVQGKIKCFLTGVKGFQYKGRTTYELQAYVDDGSLIAEILIDHHVVQNGIGYSPEVVTAALASSDQQTSQNIKDVMHKFQSFLINFEGIMHVELNRKSSLPVAIEMSQGCPQSDAWLLLRRLKSLYPPQTQTHCPSNLIELSP